MTTYKVQLTEEIRYVLTVEANSEHEAIEIATERWNQGDAGEGGGEGQGVGNVVAFKVGK